MPESSNVIALRPQPKNPEQKVGKEIYWPRWIFIASVGGAVVYTAVVGINMHNELAREALQADLLNGKAIILACKPEVLGYTPDRKKMLVCGPQYENMTDKDGKPVVYAMRPQPIARTLDNQLVYKAR